MGRAKTTRNFPLEWKTDVINTTDATVTLGEFDLDLLPDEIAEIWRIDSYQETTMLVATTDIIGISIITFHGHFLHVIINVVSVALVIIFSDGHTGHFAVGL